MSKTLYYRWRVCTYLANNKSRPFLRAWGSLSAISGQPASRRGWIHANFHFSWKINTRYTVYMRMSVRAHEYSESDDGLCKLKEKFKIETKIKLLIEIKNVDSIKFLNPTIVITDCQPTIAVCRLAYTWEIYRFAIAPLEYRLSYIWLKAYSRIFVPILRELKSRASSYAIPTKEVCYWIADDATLLNVPIPVQGSPIPNKKKKISMLVMVQLIPKKKLESGHSVIFPKMLIQKNLSTLTLFNYHSF